MADFLWPSRSHGPAGVVRYVPRRPVTLWRQRQRLPSTQSPASSQLRSPRLSDSHSCCGGGNEAPPILDRVIISYPSDPDRNRHLYFRTRIRSHGVLLSPCPFPLYRSGCMSAWQLPVSKVSIRSSLVVRLGHWFERNGHDVSPHAAPVGCADTPTRWRYVAQNVPLRPSAVLDRASRCGCVGLVAPSLFRARPIQLYPAPTLGQSLERGPRRHVCPRAFLLSLETKLRS